MHQIEIAQWAIDRTLERRGRLHVHENLDPRKTALIVVDLQNGFMVEEVAAAYVPVAVEIVPNVNRLAAAVRRTGGKVFWIKQTVDAAGLEIGTSDLMTFGGLFGDDNEAERAVAASNEVIDAAADHEVTRLFTVFVPPDLAAGAMIVPASAAVNFFSGISDFPSET